MLANASYIFAAVLALCFFSLTPRLFKRRKQPPLPPGPRPLPLIGNLLDLPKGHEGKFWAKHADVYGPISSVQVFQNTIVILNDKQIAIELFEKRSTIYSNRLVPEFVAKLCGTSFSIVFQQYGERFRSMRKLFHQFMGTRAHVSRFESLEEIEARRFLLRVKRCPNQFRAHIRRLTGTIILKLAYGYTALSDGADPMIDLAEISLQIFSQSSQPGAWLVDVLPAINYLPDWFPGTGYRDTAKQWKSLLNEGVHKPFEFVKNEMAAGKISPSFVSVNLANKIDEKFEDILSWAARDLYGGGADTTVSTLVTFILAMVLHPEVVERAREEIDQIIGEDRLPTFSDRPRLPYVEAIMKECLRWNVVTPSGVPHVAAQDDVYNGHFIPKGALIVPNIWKFTHDPCVYREPFIFKPERHLSELGEPPVELDPRSLVFGFGRRICPGKEFADSSLFITMALCLAVFNFDKAKDADGQTIEPIVEYTSGTISHPSEFACSIIPRSARAAALIESVLEEHPFEPGDADKLKE